MMLNTLEDLFVQQLRDLYDAENQLVKALPKMAKTASSPELKQAFRAIWRRRNTTSSGWSRSSRRSARRPRARSAPP